MQTQFDKGDDVDFSGCKDPHVVSNVLKLYLRELPNPLLTAESYQKFIDANCIIPSPYLFTKYSPFCSYSGR